jgi:hypothetical protein
MAENFVPRDVLSIGADKRVDPDSIDPQVREAYERFSHYTGHHQDEFLATIDRSTTTPRHFNQPPRIVVKEPGDSITHCVLSQPPFITSTAPIEGNPNSYNTAVKAHMLDYINRQRGLVDPEGLYMSTLVVAGPDRDYRPFFSTGERLAIFKGDFSPYARRVIETAQVHGYEAAYFYGYSRSAAVGASSIRMARRLNFEIMGEALAVVPNAKKRFVGQTAKSFAQDFINPEGISGHWWNDGPQIMLDLQKEFGDGEYWDNYLTTNHIGAARGMSRGKFIPDTRFTMTLGTPVVVVRAENAALDQDVEARLMDDDFIDHKAKRGLFRYLKARGQGSGHGMGENHLVHATIFSEALKELQSMRPETNIHSSEI